MIDTRITADSRSIRVRAGGPATADIWLVIDGREFPGRGWNDFAVVILGRWAIALSKILRGAAPIEVVNFMEGPFAVEITRTESGLLRLRGLERAGPAVEIVVGEGPIVPFAESLCSQAREILDECGKREWWSDDAGRLESALDVLETDLRIARLANN